MSPKAFAELDRPAVARREAAAWIARMHAPDRSRRVDAAFRRWLARSPLNEQAFELANEVWDGAGQLLHRRAVERRVGWPLAASLAALAVMLSVLTPLPHPYRLFEIGQSTHTVSFKAVQRGHYVLLLVNPSEEPIEVVFNAKTG